HVPVHVLVVPRSVADTSLESFSIGGADSHGGGNGEGGPCVRQGRLESETWTGSKAICVGVAATWRLGLLPTVRDTHVRRKTSLQSPHGCHLYGVESYG
ncbi:hypothetical protein PC116_g28247, partial [Phytophthora cactorum]